MAAQGFKRKLAAILSADVQGYSRLMDDNEEATVRTLTSYRNAITDLTQQFRGRVVDSPGDNILAEFTSVVDAVNCAVEIQRELAERNAELPYKRKMEFRIGVNLGDVIEEDDRIYGDGVNIAARVESMAEAGGICISGRAYDQVANKLGLEYENLGEHQVKNISRPIRVYRVLSYPGAAAHRVISARKAVSRTCRKVIVPTVSMLVVAAALAVWQFYLRTPPMEVASVEKMAYPLSDKPSIAVLPFDNISGDPKQEYFNDGITENIITNLSKISGLFVISRNSSFLYKGKPVKIQEVAKDLGVRYVLEGSVQRSGDRVRITVQLADGNTERHVWANSYDRELKDIFAIQDEVTQKVASELAVTLKASERERLARKHTENFEAYNMYLRAMREYYSLKKENHFKGIELCERVIELDPKFAGGYAMLSDFYSRGIRFGFSASPREHLEKAFELAQKAVSIDETFGPAYAALASAYLMKGQHDDAIAAAMTGVSIQPGDSSAHIFLGFYLNWAGRGEEAIRAIKEGRQLDPKYIDGRDTAPFDFMGFATFTAGRYEESITAWKQSLDRFGPVVLRLAYLTASYSELGMDKEARAMAKQLLETNPKFSLKSWRLARTYKNPEDTERLLKALSKAGLPE